MRRADKNNLPTYEEAHDRWKYDPETGEIWHRRLNRLISTVDVWGYVRVGFWHGPTNRKCLLKAHRLGWFLYHGYWPENGIDHANRIKTDNRIENLREVSISCNARNTGNRKNNTSEVKGVYFVKAKNKWTGQISITENGKTKKKQLGLYKEKEEAVLARYAAEQCLGWAGCDAASPSRRWLLKAGLIKK